MRDTATTPNAVTVTTDPEFIRTLRERKESLEKAEGYLEKLAEDTNGLFILPETADEMIGKTTLIARVIDSNYVVTYTPKRPLSDSEPGETRVIEVSSRKPGLRVLGRNASWRSAANRKAKTDRTVSGVTSLESFTLAPRLLANTCLFLSLSNPQKSVPN